MYFVLEIQKSLEGAGTIVAPIPTFNNLAEAESRWHTALAAAAISTVPIHTVILADEDCNVIRRETYIHKEVSDS